MPQLNLPLPSFLAGVSQQPKSVRPPEALADQVNGLVQISRGLEKRPPMEWVAPVSSLGAPALLHEIDRDENEQYILTVNIDSLNVYDKSGVSYPVYGDDGTSNPPDLAYIANKQVAPGNLLDPESVQADKADIRNVRTYPALTDIWTVTGDTIYFSDKPITGPGGELSAGWWTGDYNAFGYVPETFLDATVPSVTFQVGKTYIFSVFVRENEDTFPIGSNRQWPIGKYYVGFVDPTSAVDFPGTALFLKNSSGPLVNVPPPDAVPVNDTNYYTYWTSPNSVAWDVGYGIQSYPDNWGRLWFAVTPQAGDPIVGQPVSVRVGALMGYLGAASYTTQPLTTGYFKNARLEIHTDGSAAGPPDYYTTDVDLSAVSVADYTFIVNKSTTVEMDSAVSASPPGDELIYFVKQGSYNTAYNLGIKLWSQLTNNYAEIQGQYTTPSSGANSSTDKIAGIVSQGSGATWKVFGPDFTTAAAATKPSPGTFGTYECACTLSGSVARLVYDTTPLGASDAPEGAIAAAWSSDGGGDLFSSAFTDRVSDLTDLPLNCRDGYTVKVEPDADSSLDTYYLKFVADSDVSGSSNDLAPGFWQESLGWGLPYRIDPATMPHVLVRRQDDATGSLTGTPLGIYFTFGEASWEDRAVGDDDTNPLPYFVGRTISDVFYYGNRLGLLSGDHVMLSEAGSFFNFFRNTVLTLPDDSPLDIAVTGTDVAQLEKAVVFGGRLLLFDKDRQYQLIYADTLTPTTVRVDAVLDYECIVDARPVASGNTVFMATPKGAYGGIREMVPLGDQDIIASDITEALPSYISGKITDLASSSVEELLFVLTDEGSNIYVHSYYWQGREKILSNWGRWKMPTGVKVLKMAVLGSDLLVITEDSEGYSLEKFDLTSPTEDPEGGYMLYLDRKISSDNPNVTLQGYTGSSPVYTTEIALPYNVPAGAGAKIVYHTPDGLTLGTHGTVGAGLRGRGGGLHTVDVAGFSTSEDNFYVGVPYDLQAVLTPPYPASQAGNGRARVSEADMRLRRLLVNYAEASGVRITHDPAGSATSQVYEVLRTTPDDGTLEAPTKGRATGSKTTVASSGNGPCSFQSAEWVIDISGRSRRT
jgi:hypothetical protein